MAGEQQRKCESMDGRKDAHYEAYQIGGAPGVDRPTSSEVRKQEGTRKSTPKGGEGSHDSGAR